MKRTLSSFALCLLLLVLGFGCGGKQVTRIDANSTTDLSGEWNDTDSRLVADEMIGDCLSRPLFCRTRRCDITIRLYNDSFTPRLATRPG